MIEVELPDGTIAEFPDGTPPEVMRSAIQKRFPKRTLKDKVLDNVIGRDDGVTSPGEKLATLLNIGGESMTLGLVGDEAAAKADQMIGRGGSYDENLAKYRGREEAIRESNPALAFGAELAPALIPGAGIGASVMRVPTLAGRMGASGLLGALSGGMYGFMEGEGGADSRKTGLAAGVAAGGLLGAAIPGVGALAQKGVNKVRTSRAIRRIGKNAPTAEQLRQQGQAAYRAIDDAGVQIKPEAFSKAKGGILDNLRTSTGYDELPGPGSLTPNSARVMQIMDKASDGMSNDPTSALPFRSLDQMRRQAGAAAGNVTNKTDQKAGMQIIEGLDDLVENLSDADVVAGDVKALQSAIPKAREIWTRMSKSQKIEDAIEAGGDYLSGQGSGIRNQFKNLLRNPKNLRGFTDAEVKAMRRVAQGNIPEKILSVLGGGLGNIAAIGAGAGAGGVPGAVAGGILAAGLRKASDASVLSRAEAARRLVASGQAGNLPALTNETAGLLAQLLSRAPGAIGAMQGRPQ